ncbi:MAG TPA: hypothetical protein VFH29_06240 [Anaerolineales bacterium]|nr:hypothetical protein [Anaerolineales bacterium]
MRSFQRIAVIALALGLSSCSLGGRAETPTPAPTAVPVPTSMPTPETPLAILVVPADMDKAGSDAAQKVVYDLAQASGMRFQVRNTFGPGDLEPGLKVLIALPPDPGITALAAAAPGVQFLAINIPGTTAGGNVSVLAGNNQTDVPAFLAGYTAALISDDFRAGMILPKDSPAAQQAARAFANGMAYHCGLCTSYRLYLDPTGVGLRYPQFAEIPAGEDPSRLGGWANYVVGNLKVDAVYVFPDPTIEVRQLYDSLGQTGAKIIGTTLPNPRPGGWVMGIQSDAVRAIQVAWPELVAGRGGQSFPSPLGLADVDPAYLSPGKQRLVQKVLDDLQAGRIATGTGQ